MQPRFSPDGTQLVFISDRSGSENIWISEADGSDAKAITKRDRQSYMSPIWTPDGKYIVSGEGLELKLFHVDGGSGVDLLAQESGGPGYIGPAFGPDAGKLWVNVRGTVSGGIDVPEGRDAGTHAVPPQSSSGRVGTYQQGLLDRATGQVQVRTHEHEGAFRPVPSPDGRY